MTDDTKEHTQLIIQRKVSTPLQTTLHIVERQTIYQNEEEAVEHLNNLQADNKMLYM